MPEMQQDMNIQWYPGHMTKTRRMIQSQLKHMDAVCEILDARIPVSSRNPDVEDLTAGKPAQHFRRAKGIQCFKVRKEQ